MENEVKRIRTLLGLSQEDFAQQISETEGIAIGDTCIGNYENNERTPRPQNALAIVSFATKRGVKTSLGKIYSTIVKDEY